MNAISRALAIGLVLSALGGATGCKPHLLPGSKVEDTPLNRSVVDFMDKYKAAVEKRSSDELLALVADDYFEDNGTPDEADDYGVERLKENLSSRFENTKVIQLTVEVQHVEVDENDNVNVYYKYLQRALISLPASEQWVSKSDTNRMVLRKVSEDSDDYVIVAGL